MTQMHHRHHHHGHHHRHHQHHRHHHLIIIVITSIIVITTTIAIVIIVIIIIVIIIAIILTIPYQIYGAYLTSLSKVYRESIGNIDRHSMFFLSNVSLIACRRASIENPAGLWVSIENQTNTNRNASGEHRSVIYRKSDQRQWIGTLLMPTIFECIVFHTGSHTFMFS